MLNAIKLITKMLVHLKIDKKCKIETSCSKIPCDYMKGISKKSSRHLLHS